MKKKYSTNEKLYAIMRAENGKKQSIEEIRRRDIA